MLIGTGGTINVSTIAVIHYVSKWASYWHLWLIPNILKWQECKIFTEPVPLQTPSRSSHRRCSVKKSALKNLRNFTGNFIKKSLQLCWKETPAQVFSWIWEICKNTYFEEHLRRAASALLEFIKLNHNAFF